MDTAENYNTDELPGYEEELCDDLMAANSELVFAWGLSLRRNHQDPFFDHFGYRIMV